MTDVAVLVIDMLNTYEHEDAELLASNVVNIVDPLAGLHGERPELVEPIAPDEDCLRMLKVRHSAFYSSSRDAALTMMHKNMHAEVVPAEKCLG